MEKSVNGCIYRTDSFQMRPKYRGLGNAIFRIASCNFMQFTFSCVHGFDKPTIPVWLIFDMHAPYVIMHV